MVKDLMSGALIALLVVLAMEGLQRQQQRGGGGVLPTGEPAPSFELPSVRGERRVDVADLRGSPTVLNFWATWCGPCVRELPTLEQLHRASDGRYQVLTITDEPPAEVRAFLRERDVDLPVLHDPGGRVAERYRVSRLPMTVILDARGHVVHDFVGPAELEVLRRHMEQLRARPDDADGHAAPRSAPR